MGYGFKFSYRGYRVIETPSTYVITNEYGKTIGESKTESGARGIIDDDLAKRAKRAGDGD